jgi:hypothetical protein
MHSMRNLIIIAEGVSETPVGTVTLLDLYDEHDLTDERERLYGFIERDDWDRPLTVKTMAPEEAKKIRGAGSDEGIVDVFKAHASRDQKTLVRQKMKNYDNDRIIVLCNDAVIDGNHHLVAGIMAKQPIRYVDLAELG